MRLRLNAQAAHRWNKGLGDRIFYVAPSSSYPCTLLSDPQRMHGERAGQHPLGPEADGRGSQEAQHERRLRPGVGRVNGGGAGIGFTFYPTGARQ